MSPSDKTALGNSIERIQKTSGGLYLWLPAGGTPPIRPLSWSSRRTGTEAGQSRLYSFLVLVQFSVELDDLPIADQEQDTEPKQRAGAGNPHPEADAAANGIGGWKYSVAGIQSVRMPFSNPFNGLDALHLPSGIVLVGE